MFPRMLMRVRPHCRETFLLSSNPIQRKYATKWNILLRDAPKIFGLSSPEYERNLIWSLIRFSLISIYMIKFSELHLFSNCAINTTPQIHPWNLFPPLITNPSDTQVLVTHNQHYTVALPTTLLKSRESFSQVRTNSQFYYYLFLFFGESPMIDTIHIWPIHVAITLQSLQFMKIVWASWHFNTPPHPNHPEILSTVTRLVLPEAG